MADSDDTANAASGADAAGKSENQQQPPDTEAREPQAPDADAPPDGSSGDTHSELPQQIDPILNTAPTGNDPDTQDTAVTDSEVAGSTDTPPATAQSDEEPATAPPATPPPPSRGEPIAATLSFPGRSTET